jgi:hypothetical protein
MSTPLERQLAHYVDAVLKQLQQQHNKTGVYAQVEFDGVKISASAHTGEAARMMLSHKVHRRIYERINQLAQLPVIDGIDINPGSC